jgi:hypothetical protein
MDMRKKRERVDLCGKNEIGDEFHYILECNHFNNVRKNIDARYRKGPNTFVLLNLVN